MPVKQSVGILLVFLYYKASDCDSLLWQSQSLSAEGSAQNRAYVKSEKLITKRAGERLRFASVAKPIASGGRVRHRTERQLFVFEYQNCITDRGVI